MSAFALRYTRAINVYPSNNTEIPFPATISSGTTTAFLINNLVDTNAGVDFIAQGVKPGDIVYNTTVGAEASATVLQVVSASTLLLNTNIMTAVGGETYTIYQASDQTTIGNYGCFIYTDAGGTIKVRTIGNDIVSFSGVQPAQTLPIQVIQVYATGTSAGNLIAMWG